MQREKIIPLFRFIFLISLFFISSFLKAEDSFSSESSPAPLEIELISENETIQPGRPFWVAIRVKLQGGWHAYWKNPGDSGSALEIEWELPPGFVAGETEWPYPKRFDLSSMIGYGYDDEAWLLTPIEPPHSLSKDTQIEIKANINWLVCSHETCVPGSSLVSKKMRISLSSPLPQSQYVLDFGKARAQIPQKHWRMYAYRKEDAVKLHLQAPEHEKKNYHSALFFPDRQSPIDHKIPAVLTPKANDGGHYVITLKEENNSSKASFLRGVVILNSGTEDSIAPNALEVHVPIEEDFSMNQLAMLDRHEKEEIKQTVKSTIKENSSVNVHDFEGGLLLALTFAFLGGLLLNLMPCVLPVISFKILSFVKMSRQSRRTTLKHGLAFSGGIIASFWVLASVMLILQAYGRSAGWGFQLQEPLFVAVLAAILTLFGLSLFGVFEIGVSMTALAGSGPHKKGEGLTGSFFSGVLATTVATPCTGPFLGSAIGFAVTLPPFQALLIFTFLGLGMALPYLLLAYFPQWLRFLPKPGEWMVTFKEVMGFLMFGTVLWLLWVFGAQTSILGLILLLWALFFISFGCWIYGKWSLPIHTKMTRWISYTMTLICFSIGCYIIFQSVSSDVAAVSALQKAHEDKIWQPFSESKVANLRKKGVPVFVDFTAKWCLICQTNHMVLSTPEVEAKFDQLGVVRMKADWTKNDPKISAALRKFGRNGVPLYLLYSPNVNESPQILPQVLTPDSVIKYLETLDSNVAK